MAATMKFIADFSSFTQAVEKAVITARKFETEVHKVETSLDRMADSFSGRRIIQQAELAARAVDEIGGTSKLTKDELERLGNQAAQAIAKMKLIGETPSKRLEELATHAKSSTKELGLMSQVLSRVGPQLAAAFSVGAIVSAIRSTGEWAGKIQDLSSQFNISTESVQRFSFAARQNGTTMDQVGTGMTLLSKKVVEGDAGLVPALKRLNLTFAELRSLSPDEALRKVGAAITTLPSEMEQLATSTQFFGKSGADLLPMFRNLEADMAKAVVVSDRMIKAGDSLGDSWDSLVTTGTALIAGTLAPMAPALETAATAAARFASEQLRLAEATNTVNEELRKTKQFLPSAQTGFKDAPSPVAQQIQNEVDRLQRVEMEAQARRPMTATSGGLGRGFLREGGVPAKSLDVMEDQLKRTAAANKAGAGEMRDHAAAAKQLAEEAKRLTKIFEDLETKTKQAQGEARIAALAANFLDVQSAIDAGNLAIQGFTPNLAKLGTMAETAALDLSKVENALYALPAAVQSAGDSAGVGGGGGGGGIFGGLFGGLKGGLSSMLNELTGGGKGLSGIFSKIGTGIFEGFGNLISGGLSSLIGGGVSLAIKGIGKLFGGGEHSKVNDMRDAFIASAGGITKLAEEAQKAGTSVDRLLSAKKVKDFESAVAALDMQMEGFAQKQQDAADKLQKQVELVEKYGIALGDAPVVRDKVLADQAKGLLDDWQALIDAGVEVTKVQTGMQESIVAYLEAALKAGGEIPESFRPILEALLSTADLADLAGLSLLEMAQMAAAGFKMAATEAGKLNAELARNTYGADNNSPTQGGSVDFEPKMFDPKTGSWVTPTLASWQAAGNPSGTESQFRSAFNLDVISAARNAGFSEDYVNNWARANGGDISRFGRAHNLPGFYGGTGGRYLNFGAGTPAMLHGRERVSTESEGRAEALGFEALCATMDALRRDFSTFPEQMRDALQTRVVVAH